ncbi:MAG: hypothetical protein Q9174_002947 [Haloplaca sp. 1 TL-2023]
MRLATIKKLGKATRHALKKIVNPVPPRLTSKYYDMLAILSVDNSDGGKVLDIAIQYLQGTVQSLLNKYPHALRCELSGFAEKQAEYRIHFHTERVSIRIRFTNESFAQQLVVGGSSLKVWFENGELNGLWTCLVLHGGVDLLAGYDRARLGGATLITSNPVITSTSKTPIKKSAREVSSAPVEHHDPWEGSSSQAIKQATGDLGSEDIKIRDFGAEETEDVTGRLQEGDDSIELEEMSEVRRGKQRELASPYVANPKPLKVQLLPSSTVILAKMNPPDDPNHSIWGPYPHGTAADFSYNHFGPSTHSSPNHGGARMSQYQMQQQYNQPHFPGPMWYPPEQTPPLSDRQRRVLELTQDRQQNATPRPMMNGVHPRQQLGYPPSYPFHPQGTPHLPSPNPQDAHKQQAQNILADLDGDKKALLAKRKETAAVLKRLNEELDQLENTQRHQEHLRYIYPKQAEIAEVQKAHDEYGRQWEIVEDLEETTWDAMMVPGDRDC